MKGNGKKKALMGQAQAKESYGAWSVAFFFSFM